MAKKVVDRVVDMVVDKLVDMAANRALMDEGLGGRWTKWEGFLLSG